jgi:hypothetical protein
VITKETLALSSALKMEHRERFDDDAFYLFLQKQKIALKP